MKVLHKDLKHLENVLFGDKIHNVLLLLLFREDLRGYYHKRKIHSNVSKRQLRDMIVQVHLRKIMNAGESENAAGGGGMWNAGGEGRT